MSIPEDRQYTADHEWIQIVAGLARVGITQFAIDSLGELVFLDLPAVGADLSAGSPAGEIESTKSVSDLYAPADGRVVEVNSNAIEEPGLVNQDPYGTGWLFVMSVDSPDGLLDASAYRELCETGRKPEDQ